MYNHKIKIKLILFLGLVFIMKLMNAQVNFQLGYIIKENGDTLVGQIDYRGDYKMGEICKYRQSDSSTIKNYFPSEIIGYRFKDSKFFISKEVNGNKKFLEFLIKGKINIYYLKDEYGDHYFIEKEGIGLSELYYEEGIRTIDNKLCFYQSTKHIGLLSFYMQDVPDFQIRIENIGKPDDKNLIKLAKDYHNKVCKDEKCIIYEKKVPTFKLSIEPFLGIRKYYKSKNFYTETGELFYFWIPHTNEKLHFKTGITIQKIVEDNNNLNAILKIPFQIQYCYPSKKLRPHLSLGVNFYKLIWKNEPWITPDQYPRNNYAFCLNAGCIYCIVQHVYLNTSFNFDYNPKNILVERLRINTVNTLTNDFYFSLISYSCNIGLLIDL